MKQFIVFVFFCISIGHSFHIKAQCNSCKFKAMVFQYGAHVGNELKSELLKYKSDSVLIRNFTYKKSKYFKTDDLRFDLTSDFNNGFKSCYENESIKVIMESEALINAQKANRTITERNNGIKALSQNYISTHALEIKGVIGRGTETVSLELKVYRIKKLDSQDSRFLRNFEELIRVDNTIYESLKFTNPCP